MEAETLFVAVDPVTEQVLYACSGPAPDGGCAIADEPPYVCQGLKLVAVRGQRPGGASLTVERTVAGHCPGAGIAGPPVPVAA